MIFLISSLLFLSMISISCSFCKVQRGRAEQGESQQLFFLLLPISNTKTLFPWLSYMQRWKESWKTSIHHSPNSCLSCATKGSSSLPPSLLRYQRRLCFMISDTWDSLHALFSQGSCIPVRFQWGQSLDTSCPVLELPSLPGIPSSLEFHSSLMDKRKNCGNSMQPKGKKPHLCLDLNPQFPSSAWTAVPPGQGEICCNTYLAQHVITIPQ